ncbi:3-deoxy-7-phosphoheptulonate synthase [Thaumasiovibrio sp. DFM-14]|uniref:3-deoxy-7-phosphoheptulonate synthase n=1 Tax=Thaumasiovibrio sp. DFM-14 TaxID=3384792 RepID=UPI0039A18524
MPIKTDELRTQAIKQLPSPATLIQQLPLDDETAQFIQQRRQAIEAIISGEDSRLLVIVGPCSVHDTDAAMDYATRLAALQTQYEDSLLIVMRTYFEKPRTVVGWKGLISDPLLDSSFDIEAGLHKARELLLNVNKMGLATATEFLDMVTGQYIADLISWGAIGARTTESQIHREMASALSCPVGFKNGTDGNVQIAIDAIRSARAPHIFSSPDKQGNMTVYQTSGNPYGHIILRGGKTPNFDADSIAQCCNALSSFSLPQRLVVDFSHGNCLKEHKRQLDVCDSICEQLAQGSTSIAGIMAESFLVEGNQPIAPKPTLTYGQSITDACLSWEDSAELLERLAMASTARMNTLLNQK